MRTTAITFVVLTSAASLVSATPAREETTERISYNEHAKPPQTAAAGEPGWIELASPTPASHGREFVMVGSDAGTFTQLRVTAAAGRPEIHAVRVDYADGSHKVFHVDRVLAGKKATAYLDLRGPHELKQIVVTTDRQSTGSWSLEGNTAPRDGVAVK